MLAPLAQLFAAAAAILATTNEPTAAPSTALDFPQVELPTGATVSGKFQTNGAGHQVQVFQGIPYAEPPIGELRWKPTPLKPLAGALNATTHGSICFGDPKLDPVSSEHAASEDCLFLNVYAPAGAMSDSKLPVMVWIHGGGFIAGAANRYDGSDLVGAGDQQLVVVTFNYRLSVFGFLSNEEILSKGNGANFGLRDQEVAFQWIQEYIAWFGGDPRNVTAFGESAGAWSIAAHLVSRNGDQQLFHKAILQSGAYLPAMSTPSRPVQSKTVATLASSVGCGKDKSVLTCLRAVSALALIQASITMTADRPFAAMPLLFSPTVDGVFLLDTPLRRMLAGKISHMPTIAGTNTDEGWGFAPDGIDGSQFSAYVRDNYPLTGDEVKEVAELYPPASFLTPRHRLAEIYADVAFVCSSEQLSTTLSSSHPTYRYRFNVPSYENGYALVPHAKDLDYVFNRTDYLPHDEATNATVWHFERFWTNFARSGAPNEASVGRSTQRGQKEASAVVEWPKFQVETKQQLVLQSTLVVEKSGAQMPLHAERCAFWHSVDERIAVELEKGDGRN